MINIPQYNLISAHLEGTGGTFKSSPDSFIVKEILKQKAGGIGDHIYLEIQRSGMNTRDLVTKISKIFSIRPNDIGYTGLKDKQAIVSQSFSMYWPAKIELDEIRAKLLAKLPVTLNSVMRHHSKLKPADLLANDFIIYLKDTNKDALPNAMAKWSFLEKSGFPNYYGSQRFGNDQDNAQKGAEILKGKKIKDRWLQKLYTSALQSWIFNVYLSNRIADPGFQILIGGDVLLDHESNRFYVSKDLAWDQLKFNKKEVSYTGPMFGKKMKMAEEQNLVLEMQALETVGLNLACFQNTKLSGSRRCARFFLKDFHVQEEQEGIRLQFGAPPGSYASIVINEFKNSTLVPVSL